MSEAETIADTPLLGGVALQETLAELGHTHTSSPAKGDRTVTSHTRPQVGPPPKTVAQVLGEITWLMTQSPRHKVLTVGDLEWLVMPAVLLRQLRIFYNDAQPVGVALWALVDDTVAKRIDGGDNRLSAMEWKNGVNMRTVEVVAPFGGESEMRQIVMKYEPI